MLPVDLSRNASFYRVSNSAQVEIDRMFQWDKASVPPNRKKGGHFLLCNLRQFPIRGGNIFAIKRRERKRGLRRSAENYRATSEE